MLADAPTASDQILPAGTAAAALGASFKRTDILLAVGLTLLAFILRFYHLSTQSLWMDEVYSIYTAKAPLGEVYSYSTKMSNSLPTYFLMLRLILPDRYADIEYSARVLSALAGALSIPVFAGIVFYWRRKIGVALLAGLLLAVNPLHIWYSQEARAYALMLFFGLLAVLFLELAFASRRDEWFTLYFLASVAAIALHKSALVFPALCCVWHAVHLARQDDPAPHRYRQMLFHVPLAAIALMLMLIKLNPPPEGYRRGGSVLQFGYTFMTFLGGYSFGPSLGEIQNLGPIAAVTRSWFQIGLLVLVLALLVWVCAENWRKLAFTKETALLVTGSALLAGYAMISGFAYNVRYVLPGLFGFLALVATLIVVAPQRPWLVRGLIAAIVGLALWADAQWFYNPRYRKPDARGVAKWLINNKTRVNSWTLVPEYLQLPLDWYLGEAGQDVVNHWLPPNARVTSSFPPIPDVLLLQRRDQLEQPERLINAYRVAAGNIQTNLSFSGYELYVGDPPPSRPSK
jgi:Dolichyl-phosphate-mannose-protein mannosyltransferase